MDVRNWEFLDKRLAELGTISEDFARSGFAQQIAFTAFFWMLLQYDAAEDDTAFKAGAMSLPDHLTLGNRARIEEICEVLDPWIAEQDADAHPRLDDLRTVIEIGSQATQHPAFEPRDFS